MAYVKSTYHSVIGKKDLLWKQMDKYIFPKIKTYFQSAIWHFINGKEKRKKSNVKQKKQKQKTNVKSKGVETWFSSCAPLSRASTSHRNLLDIQTPEPA